MLCCILWVTHDLFSCRANFKSLAARDEGSKSVAAIKTSDPPAFQGRNRGYRCSANETETIASQEPVPNSNCPVTSRIMEALLNATSHSKPAVIVTVGCNKAYDFIHSLRLWSRDEKFSVKKLVKAHLKNGLSNDSYAGICGAGEKAEAVHKTTENVGIREALGWCFEPVPANIELLRKSFSDLGYLSDERVHLVQAALSSHAGTAHFQRGFTGVENSGMVQETGAPNNGIALVNMVTLDDELFSKVNKIDVLSIDTEGNDAKVLIGSLQLLSNRKVRYMEFEYHEFGQWVKSDLNDLTDILDQFGYDCYFPGNNGQLWRLTGCWHDSYYKKRWSNVACIDRGEVYVHQVMEGIAKQFSSKTSNVQH
jgi:FkbM family methyltransferase